MVMNMSLNGKKYEMKVLKNGEKNMVLFVDFNNKKGLLMNEKSIGHMYDIDVLYMNGNVSKIRLV